MREQLQQLAACGRPWAEQRAQTALQIAEAYYRREISDSEYQELMADLVRADRLDAEADDLDIKSALVSAVMIASKVA
jgi:hypothetical protein